MLPGAAPTRRGRGRGKGADPPATARTQAALQRATDALARQKARDEAAAAQQQQQPEAPQGEEVDTTPPKEASAQPRNAAAPPKSALRTKSGTARPSQKDQPTAGPSLTWSRDSELGKLVESASFTKDELQQPAALQSCIEQLTVLREASLSLAEEGVKGPEYLQAGSEFLAEVVRATAPMLAADTSSELIKLLISGGVGSLLSKPLQWETQEQTNTAVLAINKLQLVVKYDISRLTARLNLALNVARLHMQTAEVEGVKVPPPRKRMKRNNLTPAPAMEASDAPIVDLTQSDALAAMARRGRRESFENDDYTYYPDSAEGVEYGWAGAEAPGGSAARPSYGAPAGAVGNPRHGLPRHWGPALYGARAAAGGADADAAGTADTAAGRRAAGAAGALPAPCPTGAGRRAHPPTHGGDAGYGRPPGVDSTALRGLADLFRTGDGYSGAGALDTDPSDDLYQTLIHRPSSVTGQMRRNVPALELCLPLYIQMDREQAREKRATETKVKVSKYALHPLDLHLFQQAAQGYSHHYLSYSDQAMYEYCDYVGRLSQHWASVPCATLLMYDQAVREHVYLQTLTFAEATETQELWFRIVMPDLLRVAARPQTFGGRSDRSGGHGDLILNSCGSFVAGECTFMRAQQGLPPAQWKACNLGEHECPKCGGTSSWDMSCRRCWQQKKKPPRQRQQRQGGYNLQPTAQPYVPAGPYVPSGPPQQRAQKRQAR